MSELLEDTAGRAARYLAGIQERAVRPSPEAVARLAVVEQGHRPRRRWTFLVAGRVVKQGGELLGPDRERVRRLAYESRDHIFDQAREVPATADAAIGGNWMPHHF